MSVFLAARHDLTPIEFGAAIFTHWRDRVRAGTHVPLPLRRIACLLCQHEPIEEVSAALDIPVSTLQRWRSISPGDVESIDAPPVVAPCASFVALPPIKMMPDGLSSASAPTTAVLVERPDGVRFTLPGPVDLATLAALIGIGAP